MPNSAASSGNVPVPSRFNLVMPVAATTDLLVFNTLQGSAALVAMPVGQALASRLPKATGNRTMFRHFQEPANHNEFATKNELLTFQAKTSRCLSELGILVDSWEAEDTAIKRRLDDLWNPRIFKLTLSYTASCQLACSYCFEAGRDLSKRHSPALRESTLAWAEKYLDQHPSIETVHLGLFGGEPLTDINQANEYIDRLHQIAKSRGLDFTMSLTTNGLNLNRRLIEKWALNGLKYLRVTLDGPPSIHDRRRPYQSGKGSFATILQGLCSIKDIDGFGIGVSTNLDEQTVGHLSDLLDILADSGLKDQIEVLLEPTFPSTGSASEHRRRCLNSLDTRYVGSLIQSALEQVITKGFQTPPVPGLCTPCNFVQANSFVINWSGQLFRCTFTMLDSQMVVGSVEHGLTENNDRLLAARQVTAFCLKSQCAYLPLCAGGCRYWAWCQTEDWNALYCPRELWDQVLPLSLTHAFSLRSVPPAHQNVLTCLSP